MMEIRKDLLGKVPAIGDTVVFNPPYYKGIVSGKITSFKQSGLPKVITKNDGTLTPKTGFAIAERK